MPLNQNTYYTVKNNKSQQLSERPYTMVGIKQKTLGAFTSRVLVKRLSSLTSVYQNPSYLQSHSQMMGVCYSMLLVSAAVFLNWNGKIAMSLKVFSLLEVR